MKHTCDFLVLGTGIAGLTFALKVAHKGRVIILSKGQAEEANTWRAQGGVSAVVSSTDSFDSHIEDTLMAGAGLCKKNIVEMVVKQAPQRIEELMNWGVHFDSKDKVTNSDDLTTSLDLTQEGGHSHRRVLHVADHTGKSIGDELLARAKAHVNISILEHHHAVDFLIDKKIDSSIVGSGQCIGAYVLNAKTEEVKAITARFTIVASGGAGKVYLYTSNWEGATGDGIAMAHRAGARVANLEMMQFHPTCLYHPSARNFLISEAIRGEGGELVNFRGEAFMKKHHKLGSLAPRDIVARSIDAEMKRTGADSVFIDITKRDKDFLMSHFPVIYNKCLSLGIDISKDPIPVVPAAHYLCGGIITDDRGRTDITRLYAIGESACTGLHGANRLASNSLLECAVFAHNAAESCLSQNETTESLKVQPSGWKSTQIQGDKDEMIEISHMWDEIRRLMWNYVGIVRTNKRLERAHNRMQNISDEVKEYYWNYKLHPDILELRNIALIASLTIDCARLRKESRGIHFNVDYPSTLEVAQDTILD
jgi:L-aspartate oxidase